MSIVPSLHPIGRGQREDDWQLRKELSAYDSSVLSLATVVMVLICTMLCCLALIFMDRVLWALMIRTNAPITESTRKMIQVEDLAHDIVAEIDP